MSRRKSDLPESGGIQPAVTIRLPERAAWHIPLNDRDVEMWPVLLELGKFLKRNLAGYARFETRCGHPAEAQIVLLAFAEIARNPEDLATPATAKTFVAAMRAHPDFFTALFAALRKANLRSGDAQWRAVKCLREVQSQAGEKIEKDEALVLRCRVSVPALRKARRFLLAVSRSHFKR